MRYTAKRASVNRTRFRKSGMRNMFRNASKNLFMCCFDPLRLIPAYFLRRAEQAPPLQNLFRRARRAVPLQRHRRIRRLKQLRYDFETAAGLTDLVFCRLAEGVSVDRELHGQIAIAEYFDLVGLAAGEAVGAEQVWRDGFAGRENVEIGEIENRVAHAEQIVKAALGHAAMQRVLAAFKTTTA